MRPRHRVSRAAIELIKRFEGYRRKAAQLPDGRWTIGHGHTLTAREGAEVSEDDAEALLIYDLIAVSHVVNESTFAPLTQNQFDALCSFAFNLGLDNFRRSQVLKRLNEGAHLQAACAMELWRKAEFEGERIVVDALVRRRAAEKALFLTPPGDAWIPAPSPVLRPVIDADAHELIPRQAPAAVVTSMEGDKVVVTREASPEPVPPPVEDDEAGAPVRAAAETVTARLQTIFPEPGEEPAIEPEPAPGPEPAPQLAPEREPVSEGPVVLSYPRPEPEPPEAPPEADQEGALEMPAPANDAAVEPRPEEDRPRRLIDDNAAYDFIPPPVRPLPRKREPGVAFDAVLGLLGLAFFGFGVFWGLNARTDPASGFASPLAVAWLAGLAGVGFFVVAVFRLLERLGRASERD